MQRQGSIDQKIISLFRDSINKLDDIDAEAKEQNNHHQYH